MFHNPMVENPWVRLLNKRCYQVSHQQVDHMSVYFEGYQQIRLLLSSCNHISLVWRSLVWSGLPCLARLSNPLHWSLTTASRPSVSLTWKTHATQTPLVFDTKIYFSKFLSILATRRTALDNQNLIFIGFVPTSTLNVMVS